MRATISPHRIDLAVMPELSSRLRPMPRRRACSSHTADERSRTASRNRLTPDPDRNSRRNSPCTSPCKQSSAMDKRTDVASHVALRVRPLKLLPREIEPPLHRLRLCPCPSQQPVPAESSASCPAPSLPATPCKPEHRANTTPQNRGRQTALQQPFCAGLLHRKQQHSNAKQLLVVDRKILRFCQAEPAESRS